MLYAGYAKKRSNGVLNGGCPECKEGKSWKLKSRLFYIPEKNLIFCHNCNISLSPLSWIKKYSGLTYTQIMNETSHYDTIIFDDPEDNIKKSKVNQILPYDCINLFDPFQLDFYKNNKVVQDVLIYIKNRRLDTAINKTPLYISLKDFIHKNRLCIPFINIKNKITYYQTRSIYPEQEKKFPKYLGKKDCDKTVFGVKNINNSLDYLFITEGPIDSMFVPNGISFGGLNASDDQLNELSLYFLYKKIWVLDNQLDNKEVYNKYLKLINMGESVFIWPKSYKRFKDINDICCEFKLDTIKPEFFIKNSYSGLKAKLLISN